MGSRHKYMLTCLHSGFQTVMFECMSVGLGNAEDKICLIDGSEKLMERSPSADKQLSRMDTGAFSR